MKTILFISIGDTSNSYRVFYRQIIRILKKDKNISIKYIGKSSFDSDRDNKEERYEIVKINKEFVVSSKLIKILFAVMKENPAYVQASGVIELFPALFLRIFKGSKIIFDAREDYFNQAYEYSGKSISGLLRGVLNRCLEYLVVSFAECVICTDEYLYNFHSNRRFFRPKEVFLFRNFVDVDLVKEYATPPEPMEALKLVYIGGVNRYRGVIECAEFVARYNEDVGYQALVFDVYCGENDLVRELVARGLINHIGHREHPELLRALADYHIGVCLLQPLKKFERNLPMKNFEYMAVGLPVLTSNFGSMQKYVDDVKAGICIDPQSYEAFRAAILCLKEADTWLEFSENGKKATAGVYSLENEISNYYRVFED